MRALIGAPLDGTGAAYLIYYPQAFGPYENTRLTANDATGSFGRVVALENETGLVGGLTNLSPSGSAVYQFAILEAKDIGDGGTTGTNSPISGGGTTASLQVTITPNSVASTTYWTFGGVQHPSGDRIDGLIPVPTGISLGFPAYPGSVTPSNVVRNSQGQTVMLESGKITSVTAKYTGITAQPQNQTVTAFQTATFTVGYNGGGPGMFYQWRRDGTNISSANAPTYNLANVSTAAAGTYSVRITDVGTSFTSRGAVLTVNRAPQTIAFDLAPARVLAEGAFPVSATATSGQPVTLSVLSGPASSIGSNITPTGLGVVTIRATQGGTADYLPAPTVDRTFQVIASDTFNTWRDRYFTATEAGNSSVSGPTADFDRDGANHLLEYACNLLPKASDATMLTPNTGVRGLPAPAAVFVSLQRRLALQYVRRKASTAPGITYRIEFTGSLASAASWAATGTETSVTPIDSVWERVVVTDLQPADPRRFGRLVVTQP